MPKRSKACAVCADPRREQVDIAIHAKGQRRTAKEFGFSGVQIQRHVQHLPRGIERERKKLAVEADEVEDASPLVARCDRLLRQAERIAASCRVEKEFHVAVQAIREARATLELLAEMKHELERRSGVKIGLGVQVNGGGERQALRGESMDDVDREIARRLRDLTDGFKPEAIAKLKLLAPSSENEVKS